MNEQQVINTFRLIARVIKSAQKVKNPRLNGKDEYSSVISFTHEFCDALTENFKDKVEQDGLEPERYDEIIKTMKNRLLSISNFKRISESFLRGNEEEIIKFINETVDDTVDLKQPERNVVKKYLDGINGEGRWFRRLISVIFAKAKIKYMLSAKISDEDVENVSKYIMKNRKSILKKITEELNEGMEEENQETEQQMDDKVEDKVEDKVDDKSVEEEKKEEPPAEKTEEKTAADEEAPPEDKQKDEFNLGHPKDYAKLKDGEKDEDLKDFKKNLEDKIEESNGAKPKSKKENPEKENPDSNVQDQLNTILETLNSLKTQMDELKKNPESKDDALAEEPASQEDIPTEDQQVEDAPAEDKKTPDEEPSADDYEKELQDILDGKDAPAEQSDQDTSTEDQPSEEPTAETPSEEGEESNQGDVPEEESSDSETSTEDEEPSEESDEDETAEDIDKENLDEDYLKEIINNDFLNENMGEPDNSYNKERNEDGSLKKREIQKAKDILDKRMGNLKQVSEALSRLL